MLSLWGCEQEELPGDPVGTYMIVGSLEENTCGQAALPTRNPLHFEVQIRAFGEAGMWIVGDPPGFDGVLLNDGSFLFGSESFNTVIEPGAMLSGPEQPEDYINGTAGKTEIGCTISIVEQIDGRLNRTALTDAGTNNSLAETGLDAMLDDLAGENRIDMAPMPGSDCSPVLATQGGPFLALPCFARYTLRGELIDTPAE